MAMLTIELARQSAPRARFTGIGAIMTELLKHASVIMACYERAEAELVGKAVVLTDGKAGTVDGIWLDELHGLRISIGGHFGKWPVSSLKLVAGLADAAMAQK